MSFFIALAMVVLTKHVFGLSHFFKILPHPQHIFKSRDSPKNIELFILEDISFLFKYKCFIWHILSCSCSNIIGKPHQRDTVNLQKKKKRLIMKTPLTYRKSRNQLLQSNLLKYNQELMEANVYG